MLGLDVEAIREQPAQHEAPVRVGRVLVAHELGDEAEVETTRLLQRPRVDDRAFDRLAVRVDDAALQLGPELEREVDLVIRAGDDRDLLDRREREVRAERGDRDLTRRDVRDHEAPLFVRAHGVGPVHREQHAREVEVGKADECARRDPAVGLAHRPRDRRARRAAQQDLNRATEHDGDLARLGQRDLVGHTRDRVARAWRHTDKVKEALRVALLLEPAEAARRDLREEGRRRWPQHDARALDGIAILVDDLALHPPPRAEHDLGSLVHLVAREAHRRIAARVITVRTSIEKHALVAQTRQLEAPVGLARRAREDFGTRQVTRLPEALLDKIAQADFEVCKGRVPVEREDLDAGDGSMGAIAAHDAASDDAPAAFDPILVRRDPRPRVGVAFRDLGEAIGIELAILVDRADRRVVEHAVAPSGREDEVCTEPEQDEKGDEEEALARSHQREEFGFTRSRVTRGRDARGARTENGEREPRFQAALPGQPRWGLQLKNFPEHLGRSPPAKKRIAWRRSRRARGRARC